MSLKTPIMIVSAFCVSLLVVSFGVGSNFSEVSAQDTDQAQEKVIVMNTSGVLHTIPLDKIKSGGVPMDGIPSIDDPIFVNITDAHHMSDSDIIMGLASGGEAKAYPLFILVWHEIVNDDIDDTPVSVTYCPLCYTSQVFERVINGVSVEFGTTGKLYQSNLLMYDRTTHSYWSQALGMAVKGPLSGQELSLIPFDLMTWADWKTLYPDTLVLGTDTGFSRAYGVDPYGSYYTDDRIWFPIDSPDDRMHPKEIIVGLRHNDTYKAYSQATIESEMLINDTLDSQSILLLSLFDENTRVFDRAVENRTLTFELANDTIKDVQTNSIWDYNGTAISGELSGTTLSRLPIEPAFWFSWHTFHPATLIYGEP